MLLDIKGFFFFILFLESKKRNQIIPFKSIKKKKKNIIM